MKGAKPENNGKQGQRRAALIFGKFASVAQW
jgi:hypothetical protein